jgi:hypothetical protein
MVLRAATLTALALLLPAAAAAADSARFGPVDVSATDLVETKGAVRLSAAGGHVVFSRAVSDRVYRLFDWSAAGGLRTLAAGTRTAAFDADAGLDANGRPVVVFSTCPAGNPPGQVPHRGCSLRMLRLDQGDAQPRALRLHGDHGMSLTTPSMHGHAVAAVAAPAVGSRNVRIMYWRTAGAAPRRLSGGTASCPSYARCKSGPPTAVDALDLGRRSVAFVWELDSGANGIGANQELRTARLNGAHSRQAARAFGYISGACGYRDPESPNALADGGVGFVLAQSPCDDDQTTIARWAAGAGDFQGARPNGTFVGGAAWDGARIYWLSCAPRHDPSYDADVISDACRLVVSTAVPFGSPTRSAHG